MDEMTDRIRAHILDDLRVQDQKLGRKSNKLDAYHKAIEQLKELRFNIDVLGLACL